jgi:hypothetical protein
MPAPSAQQQRLRQLGFPNHQQDFVLFPETPSRRPSRPAPVPPLAHGPAIAQQQTQQQSRSHEFMKFEPSLASQQDSQNSQVASVIQATGHRTNFGGPYSAPISQSSVDFFGQALPRLPSESRPARPPVPAFPQAQRQPVQQANMSGQDMHDFSAFDGGASTPAHGVSPDGSPVWDTSGTGPALGVGTTVAPSQLFIGPFGDAAPGSSTFTNLTSPSVYGNSPLDAFDVSPMLAGNELDGTEPMWPSLFEGFQFQSAYATVPDATAVPEAAASYETSPTDESSVVESEEAVATTVAKTSAAHRRKSSNSPATAVPRPSATSGVKPRARDRPLKPIVISDPGDPVQLKRARNTLAARKSRALKAENVKTMEGRIEQLEKEKREVTEERDYWRKLAEERAPQ